MLKKILQGFSLILSFLSYWRILVSGVVIFLWLTGCNDGGSAEAERTDTAETSTIDSSAAVNSFKTATLGYSYPQKIMRGKSKSINVYVSVSNPAGEVEDTLRKIATIQKEVVNGNDSVIVETTSIVFYKYLTVKLIDRDKVFDITQIHDNERQLVDTVNGNTWRWVIKTNTDQNVARLILKISAEKPDRIFDDKDLAINVLIDNSGLLRRLWIWLQDHPESLLTLIIIPIFIYLWRSIFGKKKDKRSYY